MEELNALWEKYLAGKLSPKETRQLSEALAREEYQLVFSRLLEQEWHATENRKGKSPSDKVLLEKIKKELGIKKRSPFSRTFYRYAASACLLLFLGLGIWWTALQLSPENNLIRLQVAAGAPPRVFVLPDSSSVWLNSATTLEYTDNFTRNRQVKLEGEAYFRVKSDSSSPFRVNFGDYKLMVTGTRFNIKAYADENLSRIGVEEGSVRVYHYDDSTDLYLDNRLVIDRQKAVAMFDNIGFSGVNSWMEGTLNFRDIPLDEVLNTLERHYGIHIDARALAQFDGKKRITAFYPAQTSLDEVMEGLSHLQDFHYEFTDRKNIKIRPAKENN